MLRGAELQQANPSSGKTLQYSHLTRGLDPGSFDISFSDSLHSVPSKTQGLYWCIQMRMQLAKPPAQPPRATSTAWPPASVLTTPLPFSYTQPGQVSSSQWTDGSLKIKNPLFLVFWSCSFSVVHAVLKLAYVAWLALDCPHQPPKYRDYVWHRRWLRLLCFYGSVILLWV